VELLGIIAAVHAIMNARTSQGAIAWGISLVTFHWLALILYAIFGRNKFKGYTSLRNLRDKSIQHIIDYSQGEAVKKKLICEELTTYKIA
jgi:cardiolipin synthase